MKQVATDPLYSKIKEELQDDPDAYSRFLLEHGKLLYPTLLKEYHRVQWGVTPDSYEPINGFQQIFIGEG